MTQLIIITYFPNMLINITDQIELKTTITPIASLSTEKKKKKTKNISLFLHGSHRHSNWITAVSVPIKDLLADALSQTNILDLRRPRARPPSNGLMINSHARSRRAYLRCARAQA